MDYSVDVLYGEDLTLKGKVIGSDRYTRCFHAPHMHWCAKHEDLVALIERTRLEPDLHRGLINIIVRGTRYPASGQHNALSDVLWLLDGKKVL